MHLYAILYDFWDKPINLEPNASFCFLLVFEFCVDFTSGGVSPGCPRGRGHALGGGRAPHPRGQPGTLLACFWYSVGFFWSKNDLRQVAH